MSNSGRKRIQKQIENLRGDIQKTQAKIRKLQTRDKAQQRKARTRELIQVGGLAEIAELLTVDKGALLGLLLRGKEVLQDEDSYLKLKQRGDNVLAQRARKRKSKGTAHNAE